MSEYRLAEKPTLDALIALGYKPLSPEAALQMRVEENRVILKPVLIEALQALNGIGTADAEAIYSELSILSDNEEWQRKLRGAYSRRLPGEVRDRPITLIDFKHPEQQPLPCGAAIPCGGAAPAHPGHCSVCERHSAGGDRGEIAAENHGAGRGGV